jgi:Rrf2 family transcriptional regulator, iron-sulfur cluster assembly transcription factor
MGGTMLYSKAAEYAIQAMIYMANHANEDGLVQLKDVAMSERIPFHFLAKTMQVLSREGLVNSHRGPRGGFCLARPANEITIYDIVYPIDNLRKKEDACVLGYKKCSDELPCPVRSEWQEIHSDIQEKVLNRDIASLAEIRQKAKEAAAARN